MIFDNILAIIIVNEKNIFSFTGADMHGVTAGNGYAKQYYNKNIKELTDLKKYTWETSDEIIMQVAENVRKMRKRLKISQQDLSRMSGVSYGSVKRFESTGNISLISLTKIAAALDATDEIKKLFTDIPYKSIQEVINEQR